jgi:hypothetical protein
MKLFVLGIAVAFLIAACIVAQLAHIWQTVGGTEMPRGLFLAVLALGTMALSPYTTRRRMIP